MTPDLKTSLDAIRRRIDLRLEAVLPQTLAGQTALTEALRDGVLAPGKRLRPLMTVVVAEDLGGATEAAIDAGCAVEMVHAASLVLDDLPCMDDATMRRGLPAVHIGHGEDVAVLVAIGALAGSSQLLATIPDLGAEARLEAIAILSRAVGVRGLVAGQFEDLRGGAAERPVARIAAANGLKTGSLFSAAVEIGGVIAGAREPDRAELRLFAQELGHAFQLVDDLLDQLAAAAELGKDVGQDRNKSTIVAMMGPAAVQRRIERHASAAERSLACVFGPGSRMQGLVDLAIGATLRAAMPAERAPRPAEAGAGEREVGLA
ncbi:geranylgeranyl pyrophosphate synthase [Aureimonas endophytica]|uniref:Probable farnesyl diphosphate synthase n=1 Tax=Aureimonas endophytica TaxID=2027858 RepID=A0A916ZIM8_9HYPH|nr:polyprenyl synthetase family protein [Aureimonas endophytica]GGD99898.1 geranylgeranyl pyrophosphate synthase [Aureimonas endophytica]